MWDIGDEESATGAIVDVAESEIVLMRGIECSLHFRVGAL